MNLKEATMAAIEHYCLRMTGNPSPKVCSGETRHIKGTVAVPDLRYAFNAYVWEQVHPRDRALIDVYFEVIGCKLSIEMLPRSSAPTGAAVAAALRVQEKNNFEKVWEQ